MVIQSIFSTVRYVLIGLVIVLAIVLSSVRLLLLSVENYKSELENTVFELTTIPVEIGTIKANMRGFTPGIILKDIHFLGAEKDQAFPIMLDEIRLDIDLMQLLFSRQILPSSQLTLVGVKLSVIRKKDGTLSIVGLDTAESEQPYWLLKGGQYKVLKSDITWLDELRNGQPVHFNKVDLSINNDFDAQTHEAHLLAQLPEKYGKSLRVSLSIQGNVFEEDDVNGRIYVEGDDIHLAELVTGDMPLGIKIMTGEGSFKIWSEWNKSELSSLLGRVQAKKITLVKKQGTKKRTFKISSLSTEFSESKVDNGWLFGVTDFALKTKKHSWPLAAFNIAANDQLTHLSASITQLELQEMSELLHFFAPLNKEKKALVSQLDLKGMLKDFSIYAEVETNRYAVNGLFENISVNKYFSFPQLENMTGSVKGTHERGTIDLNTKQAKVFFPKLFRKAFSVNQLLARIKWLQMPDEWRVSSQYIALETKDLQTESKLNLIIPKDEAPLFMDLQSSFASTSDMSHAFEYYPVSIMDRGVVDWLDNAFVSGKISQGGLLVYGKLDQFPFVEGQGVFEVLFNVEDAELQYHPEWPHFENLTADILFLKDSLTINTTRAKVNDLKVKHASIKIPSFEKSNYLLIEGQAEGDIIAGLTFLQQTPLHVSIDNVLDAITPKGLTRIELDMKVPLVESVSVVVDGTAYFKDAAVNIKSVDLNVTEVSGDLKFTEKGLFSEQIKANALGFPIDVIVDSKNFDTTIRIAGKTDFIQLKKQFDFLKSDVITEKRFTGSILYNVDLDLPVEENKPAVLSITSDLEGMAIDLPDSVKKTSMEKKYFFLNLLLSEKALLPLSLNYNDFLKAAINIDKELGSIHSAHIVLGLGQVEIPQQEGIKIQVNQEVFDASEWTGFVKGSLSEEQNAEPELSGISLMTRKLLWKGEDYGAFEMAAQRFGKQWQGSLSSSIAKGAFVVPLKQTEQDKIKLQMGFINLSELVKLNSQADEFTADDLLMITISSEKLWWDNVNLGRLDVETEKLAEGVRFKRINVTSKKHKIELSVDWLKKGQSSVTELHGTLVADDMGDFLSKLDFSNDLEEAETKIDFSAAWQGSPYQFSLATVGAEVNVELKDGRISSIEPGFGRVLGFLAMEQWIKRLTLDFSDLYKKGLSFNSITGRFNIAKGKAVTTDLLVDAIPAQIRIVGETDLVAKTLDHRVGVIPKSSGAVPIAGTIVSSIAGTITKVLTSDYEEGYFFGSKYKVIGKWDDVKVIPLHEQDGLLKKTWTGLTDFSWMGAGGK
jgi:uncharacterized protein (TIGR02099 family)